MKKNNKKITPYRRLWISQHVRIVAPILRNPSFLTCFFWHLIALFGILWHFCPFFVFFLFFYCLDFLDCLALIGTCQAFLQHKKIPSNMSHVTCHMSPVTCHKRKKLQPQTFTLLTTLLCTVGCFTKAKYPFKKIYISGHPNIQTFQPFNSKLLKWFSLSRPLCWFSLVSGMSMRIAGLSLCIAPWGKGGHQHFFCKKENNFFCWTFDIYDWKLHFMIINFCIYIGIYYRFFPWWEKRKRLYLLSCNLCSKV